MPHCQISNLCFSPFWTQVPFQIPTRAPLPLIPPYTPAGLLCILSQSVSLQSLPDFTLLPDPLEFTLVPYHLSESPICLGNNPQLKDSPHIPSLPAPRLPSSIRKSTKRMGCTSYSCFLISTSLQTLQQPWTKSWFPLLLTFGAQVFLT